MSSFKAITTKTLRKKYFSDDFLTIHFLLFPYSYNKKFM